MAVYTELCFLGDTGGTVTLTEEIEGTEIAVADMLAYSTYGQAYVLSECRGGAQLRFSWSRYETVDLSILQGNENKAYFYFANRVAVSDFAWTDDDDERIRAGQPVTNLTAAAMNRLYEKLVALKGLTSMRAAETVSEGAAITADSVSLARSAIARGLRSVDKDAYDALAAYEIRRGAPIQAALLMELKHGVNKLIQEMRP